MEDLGGLVLDGFHLHQVRGVFSGTIPEIKNEKKKKNKDPKTLSIWQEYEIMVQSQPRLT